MTIPKLCYNLDEFNLLSKDRMNLNSIPIMSNQFMVLDPIQKLDVFSFFYESINNPRSINDGTYIKNIVEANFNRFMRKINFERRNGITISIFNSDDSLLSPALTDCPSLW